MKWTLKNTAIAGVTIIACVNAIALGGAAYNRSGVPESSLRLSERELDLPYESRGRKEDSGLTLRLDWRVLTPVDDSPNASQYYSTYGRDPVWLDE